MLEAGKTYLAVARGTARIATDSTGFTDAEFIRYNKSTGPQDGSSPGYAWNNHGLRLSGVEGGDTTGNLWGSYQADHQYVQTFVGQGTTIRSYYSDIPGYYGDNSGTLQLDLYAESKSGQLKAVRADGSGETTHGWVAENNDNDNYNFRGNQATSLDQIFDKDDPGEVDGENDLIALHIYAVDGAVTGDRSSLHFTSSNIRIWTQADKGGGLVLSDTTFFDATKEHMVYVEGLKLSEAVDAEIVTLNWISGVIPNFQLPVDQVKLTVYDLTGSLDVPGYSRHTYNVTLPGKNVAVVDAITEGALYAPVKSVASPDGKSTATSIIVNWGAGEVVGKVSVKLPNGDSSPPREVNVVRVDLDIGGPDNKLTLDDSKQTPVTSIAGYGVDSNPAFNSQPMYASIKVLRIAGPLGPDQKMRGPRFIDLGFVQTISFTSLHGDYGDPAQFRRVSKVPVEGETYIDGSVLSRKPWYNVAYKDPNPVAQPAVSVGNRGHVDLNDELVTNKLFDMYDGPGYAVADLPAVKAADGTLLPLTFLSLVAGFDTYFVVHTKDKTNGADRSYTIRASLHWDWNGSGKVTLSADKSRIQTYTSSLGEGKRLTVPAGQGMKFKNETAGEIADPKFTEGTLAIDLLDATKRKWETKNI